MLLPCRLSVYITCIFFIFDPSGAQLVGTLKGPTAKNKIYYTVSDDQGIEGFPTTTYHSLRSVRGPYTGFIPYFSFTVVPGPVHMT